MTTRLAEPEVVISGERCFAAGQVTARRKKLSPNWVPENVQEVITLSCAAIQRLAPPGTAYLDQMETVLKDTDKSISRSKDEEIEFRLRGILAALRADYQNGRVMTFRAMGSARGPEDGTERPDTDLRVPAGNSRPEIYLPHPRMLEGGRT